jgi:hypothetical protein
MRWSIALLAALGLAGCGTRAGIAQASGDYDEGQGCRNAGGSCYQGEFHGFCLQTGPSGCDEDPTAPDAIFCCIQFADASLYPNETAQTGANETVEAGANETVEAGANETVEAGE